MKIRNGFVSNSSSSSFVVVFPKKPQSVEDIKKYMFGSKDADGNVTYYNNTVSQQQVAEQVFSELSYRSASKNNIIKEFNSGWRYHPGFNWKGEGDPNWVGTGEPYFGNSKEAMLKLAELERDHKKNADEYYEKHHAFQKEFKKKLGECPEYNNCQEYKEYQKKLDALKDSTEGYRENEKSQFDNDYWEELNNLTLACATADAEEFLKTNKGKYVGIFHYADDEGVLGCTMEHGDIFEKLDHVRFSHH